MNPSNTNHSAGLGMSPDYFNKNLIPQVPVVQEQVYAAASSLFHYHGIWVIYVTEGKGKVVINERTCPCRPGTVFVLTYHHIARIVPETELSVLQCQIPLNTFFYLLANPCCVQMDLGIEEQPVFGELPSPEKERIEALFGELRKELSEKSSFHNDNAIFILLELLARIDRETGSFRQFPSF